MGAGPRTTTLYPPFYFRTAGLLVTLFAILLLPAPPPSSPPPRAARLRAPSALPLWPDAYCLDDRLSDVFIGHWFTLTVAGFLSLIRPGYTVVLFAPWLDPARFPLAFKSWHNESIAMLQPEFRVHLRDQRSLESCYKFGGLELLHNDRPLPDSGIFLLRDFFLAKVRARGPIEPVRGTNLYYFTRRGAGEGKIQDRAAMVRRRNVDNEDAFLPGLMALGFRVVHLEDYTVEGKIRLFAGARMVVGPQSAAFTFIPMMGNGTDVVEIFPDLDLMKHYCYMARPANAYWQRYTAVTTVGAPPTTNFGNGPFNMLISDPSHFVEHIRQLLAHPERRAHPRRCKINGDPNWPQLADTD